MTQALLCFSTPETWILLLAAAGIIMMIGFRKTAAGLAGSVMLLALLLPFIQTLMNTLPMWVLVVIMVVFGMSLFRLIFGRRVADHLIARILYDFIRLPFRFFGWIFRGPGRRV